MVRHLPRAAAKQAVGKGMPLGDGHRRQGDAVGHVANGIDGVNGCPRNLIDDDLAAPAQFDACRLKPQPGGVRRPASGGHDLHHVKPAAVAEGGDPAVSGGRHLG